MKNGVDFEKNIVKVSFNPFGVEWQGVYQPQVSPAVTHIEALRAFLDIEVRAVATQIVVKVLGLQD